MSFKPTIMSKRENSNTGMPLPHNEQSHIICKREATEEEEFPKTDFLQRKVESELYVAIKLPNNTPVKQERDETISELTVGEIVEKHETVDYFNEEQSGNHHCGIPASNYMFKAEEVTYLNIEDNETLDFKIFKSQIEEKVEIGMHSLDVEGSITIKGDSEVDFGLLENKAMPLSVGDNKINKLLMPLVAVSTEHYGTICKEEPDYENQMWPVELINSTSECLKEVAIKKESAKVLVDIVPKILSTNLDQVNLKSEQKPHYKSTDLNTVNATGSRNSLPKKDIPINKTTCKNCGMQIEDLKNLCCDCNDGWLSNNDDKINADKPKRCKEQRTLQSDSLKVRQTDLNKNSKDKFSCKFVQDVTKRYEFTYSKEKPICCDVCNKRFSQNGNLVSHKRTHSKEKPFCCDVCNKRFSHSNTLINHKRTHTNEKPFCCDFCNKRFSDKSNLVSHKRTHSKEKPFCCDVCNKRFSHSITLVRHKRTHTKEKPFCCDVCSKIFSLMSNLVSHKRTHTKEKPFCCDVCNKRFSDKCNLVSHKRTLSKEKPFCCNVCNNRFSQKSTLVSHKRTHSKEKPFCCNVCNKRFSHSNTLVNHKRTHTNEKPFCCDFCNKRYTERSTLVRHIRTHTKYKTFPCDVCNNKFSQMSNLISHKRTHTNEKPFCCDICKKRFYQNGNLVSHKRSHSKEKPFCCNVCNNRFSQKSTLVSHKRTHTKEKPFTCNVCNKSFSSKPYLKTHIEMHFTC